MICLALTGGIACGKSELGRLLERLGAETVDADVVVGLLHGPGGRAAESVAALFGRGFLLPDGSTDKARLARLVFSDGAARRKLENALHPIVRKWLLDWKKRPGGESSVRVAQIPLLFESSWSQDWDFTATVETSSLERRLDRLAARGLSRAEAEARIASQLPGAERVARADFAIMNDAGKEQLGLLATALMKALEARAATNH